MAEDEDGGVELRVRDDGRGFDPAVRRREALSTGGGAGSG